MADDTITEPDNIRKPSSYDGKTPQVLTADTARQAPKGKPVLYVLIASLAAAVVALGLYWAFWSASIPNPGG